MLMFSLDLHCEELPPPENGTIEVTGENFGDTATYSCREGYWLAGDPVSVCQEMVCGVESSQNANSK
ncbi:hypothetical protein TNIN_296831 [Trichonephila inaurata madagascariensis]|uniref:Sushi domain-containing protein n=1 Tax=Trichonephila inaurata madagascariensis TaxID=2747483 RepID=A0A8X6YVS3_9ARAC|nr:hypothetical protein TNIN_296831 [Trichonephila inaurata madagascariensis]